MESQTLFYGWFSVLVLLLLGLTIWWLFFDEEIVEERKQVEKETKTPSPAQVAMSIEELSKMTKNKLMSMLQRNSISSWMVVRKRVT